jgi:hypothetical protein
VGPAIALAADGFAPPAQMIRIRNDGQRDLGGADKLGGR